MQYPLSPDEHAALSRCLTQIRKQIQEASDLFSLRYSKDSSIAEIAVKSLVSVTLLEHELALLDSSEQPQRRSSPEFVDEFSTPAA